VVDLFEPVGEVLLGFFEVEESHALIEAEMHAIFLCGLEKGGCVASGTDSESRVFCSDPGEIECVAGPGSAIALVFEAHIEMGVEVKDAEGALGTGGIEGGEAGESDFVTPAETDHELRFFQSGTGEAGELALGGFKVFVVAGNVAEVVEAEGLMDGEVAESGADVLRALLGSDSTLVSKDAFVAGESEEVDDAGILGCTDFDNVVPAVSGVSVERVVASLPGLFGWFYEHL
jgi:hypothetical protein